MSHLTTHKSNVLVNTNKEMLGASLSELGIQLDYDNRTIRNQWITEQVDAAFIYNDKRIAVGINFKTNAEGKEEVEVAGDFYGTGLNQKELVDRISQVYQKNNVIEKCRQQRWNIDPSNIVEKDGKIIVQAYRYA